MTKNLDLVHMTYNFWIHLIGAVSSSFIISYIKISCNNEVDFSEVCFISFIYSWLSFATGLAIYIHIKGDDE